nr:glycosyltransferase [Gluconacetobacter aggeris]
MPLTHFGEENSGQPNGLGFLIYVLGLGECDILLPVSRASSEALTGLFGRYGILPTFDRTVKPILLPEEVIGEQSLAYLKTSSREHQNSIEFCMWGTIFPHKNFVSGMEAFNILCQRRPDLDLRLHHVGSVSGESMDAVRRLVRQSRGRIILHGFVSDAELSMIARRSRASIFVSLAEGYGLPLSESLWLGLPCITSAFAPMTEIAAGGGALLVDPTDTESIARGIEKIATDSVLYERLKNELRARNFRTWKQYSYEVLQEIRAVDVTARERVHVLNYIPLRSTSASMQLEVLGFDLSDMSIPEAYDAVSVPLVADGVLKYERDEHFAVSHPVICFGPYVTVGAGRYVIVFDGILKGKCLICITSDEGRNIYLEKIIDTLETKLEFVTDKIMSKMEIVFTKTPELESLSLDAIWVTRYSLS